MDPKEIYAAVERHIAHEAASLAIDEMLYGRSIICITKDGVHRVPPEDWNTLGDGIVVPSQDRK